jgi:hypothetical protein
MNPKRVLRFIALGSAGLLMACGGVSTIGSGDELAGRSGSTGISSGGTKGTDNSVGTGAASTGASTEAGGGTGAQTSVDTAGTDSGTGGVTRPGMCTADTDCMDDSVPCEECVDGSYACNKPFCKARKCLHSGEMCPAQCMSDEQCPALGLACTNCGDGTKSCPRTQCVSGKCQTSFPGCHNVDPCKGLACGAPCKQCSDGNCDSSLLPLYCGADGKCEPGLPQCGADVKCRTARDCKESPPECVACAADTCAGFECVDGACVLACPPNPDPQCKTTLDCPATGVCRMCPGGSCASRVCWKGNCELACEP